MNLRRLHYFMTLAAQGHFGRAAAELGIAQSALSQQMQVLEREFGAKLLDRSNRQVTLTQAGSVLLPAAESILREVAQAQRDVRAVATGGELRIGHTRSAPGSAAPDIIREFRRRYPDVTVKSSSGYTGRNIDDLQNGALDAAFVRPPIEGTSNLDHLVVEREPLVVALPADHPLANLAALSPDQLRDQPIISWPESNSPGLRQHIDAVLWGGTGPEALAEEPDEEHMARAVARGEGVAVCFEWKFRTLMVPGMVLRAFREPVPHADLALAWLTASTGPPPANVLRLVEVAQEWARAAAG